MKWPGVQSGQPINLRAFTRLELVVVIAVLVLVVVVVLTPRLGLWKPAKRIRCASNQKQIGLAFLMFAGDHDDRFPFQVPDSPAYSNASAAWIHLQTMSNELGSAKLLVCPADASRMKTMASDIGTNADSLAAMQDRAVSYFIGIDATETNSAAILLGDRNVMIPGNPPAGSLLTVHSNETLRWGNNLHTNCGNIAFADSSTLQVGPVYVLPAPGTATGNQRLLLPLVSPPSAGRRADIDFWVENPR